MLRNSQFQIIPHLTDEVTSELKSCCKFAVLEGLGVVSAASLISERATRHMRQGFTTKQPPLLIYWDFLGAEQTHINVHTTYLHQASASPVTRDGKNTAQQAAPWAWSGTAAAASHFPGHLPPTRTELREA